MRFASTCRSGVHALRVAAFVAAALAAAVVGTRAQGTGRGQGAVFRAETDLVVLQVSVVDPQQRFVTALEADDFGVYEEGARQNVLLFASSTAPLDLMVLLDTSVSMTERMALAQEAAINLLRALRPEDRAAIVLFSDRVRIARELTGDLKLLEAAVREASPAGATALYEALYVAMRELAYARRTAGGDLRRQGLVVLSDGEDNMSRAVAFEDVIDLARRSALTIFTIVPAPSSSVPHRDQTGRVANQMFEMRQLADTTGGRAFAPLQLTDLAGVYDQIADELGQQYWLAYTPPRSKSSGFRRVSVRVETRPGLRARTRSGYYAGGGSR
jgi:Ca-activated chloride channel family protein